MRSIERHLLSWIMGALALGALLVSGAAYFATLDEMNEIFDADLANVAEAIAGTRPSGSGQHRVAPGSGNDGHEPDDSAVTTLLWSSQGQLLYTSNPRLNLPFSREHGLAQRRVDGVDWVIYTSVHADTVAQAAQRVMAREEMAGEATATMLPPLLLLFVGIGAVMVLGLRRGLRPLDDTARDVAARSARTLAPIATAEVPDEITPLVSAINGLMQRLSEAFAAQRLFLADAAHELRTPVTALRLQLQLLHRSPDEASRQEALRELQSGIDRTQQLIEQLLLVARAERDVDGLRFERVQLDTLVRDVVTRMAVKADRRQLDLGVVGTAQVAVMGDIEQLTVLLNNLVENALRYTPAGGVIDVEACLVDGHPTLRVVDTGPGIPDAERERVFDRFYRGASAQSNPRAAGGSGLGLAIVRTIAERHGARVLLADAPGSSSVGSPNSSSNSSPASAPDSPQAMAPYSVIERDDPPRPSGLEVRVSFAAPAP